MIAFYPELLNIVKVMSSKEYVVFQDPKGYDLNIVGIRNSNPKSGSFDDFMCVFYK